MKVVPPYQITLKTVILQSVSDRVLDNAGNILAYHLSFEEQKTMNYGTLEDIGMEYDAKNADLSIEEHEDVFWKNIAQRTNVPLYSIDNELSLFPRSETNVLICCWNLAKFTNQESLIHQVCDRCCLHFIVAIYPNLSSI